MSTLLNRLEETLADKTKSVSSPKARRYTVSVEPEKIVDVAKILFNDFKGRLMTATCVDEGLDFSVLYHFDIGGEVATLGTSIPKEDPHIQSIASVVPAAQWIEREMTDLFGVKFEKHPQPEILIAAESWKDENPPLQKPREGKIVPEYRSAMENVISTGTVVPFSSFVRKRREQSGLPKPTITTDDEEALDEVHKILRRSEVDKRTGFDWEKKKLRYK